MRPAIRTLFPTFLLLLATVAIADNPDFSGSYTLTGGDRRLDARKAMVVTITVKLTPIDMEFTTVKDGQKTVNRVTLDGKASAYNTLRGPYGTCKARIKGKTLILEVLGSVRVDTTQVTMSVHSTEVWQLSSDSKTLTIRGEDLLLNPPTVIHLPPWTEIYTRN
jgi:hypothetical protein